MITAAVRSATGLSYDRPGSRITRRHNAFLAEMNAVKTMPVQHKDDAPSYAKGHKAVDYEAQILAGMGKYRDTDGTIKDLPTVD